MTTNEPQFAEEYTGPYKTMFVDEYEDAIIGYVPEDPIRAVYSKDKMLFIYIKRNYSTFAEAYQFLSYNVWDEYVGKGTPIYMWEETDRDTIAAIAEI